MSSKKWVECPICGQDAIAWFDDATHSARIDISDYDHMDVCYTYDNPADGYIHVFNDPAKAKG